MIGLKQVFRFVLGSQFFRTALAIGRKISRHLYSNRKAYIFELDKENHIFFRKTPILPNGYVGRNAIREEMQICSESAGAKAEEYYRRYDNNDICYAVFTNRMVASINWVHKGSAYIRGMGYTHYAEATYYYIYGIVTNPSHRGRGLYKNCLSILAEYLFEQGAAKLVQMVEEYNKPVFHTLPQLGYIKTKTIKHIEFMGIKYTVDVNLLENSYTRKLFLRAPKDLYTI